LNEKIRFKTRLGMGDGNFKLWPWGKKKANNYTTRWFLLKQEKLLSLGAEGELNKKE